MLLTPEDVADILGLSLFTVRRLLREGVLPGRKVGKRQWRILRADLDDYLNTPQPAPKRPTNPQQDRLQKLAEQQGVKPVTDFAALLASGWPDDETRLDEDDFLAPIYELREQDAARSVL